MLSVEGQHFCALVVQILPEVLSAHEFPSHVKDT